MRSIKDTVETAKDKLEELTEDAAEYGKEKLGEAVTDLRRVVRKNPGTAVLVALGVGVVVGLALRRRD